MNNGIYGDLVYLCVFDAVSVICVRCYENGGRVWRMMASLLGRVISLRSDAPYTIPNISKARSALLTPRMITANSRLHHEIS